MNKKRNRIINLTNIKSFILNNITHMIAYFILAVFGTTFTNWLLSSTNFNLNPKYYEFLIIFIRITISITSWAIIIGVVFLGDFLIKSKNNKLEYFKKLQTNILSSQKQKEAYFEQLEKEHAELPKLKSNISNLEKELTSANKLIEKYQKEIERYNYELKKAKHEKDYIQHAHNILARRIKEGGIK